MVTAILSAVGSTLSGMLFKVLAGPALEALIIKGLELLAEKTDSKADDELVRIVKEALNNEEEKK